MLASIHPLGERGRDNKWALTVASFTAASTLVGSGVGLVLGGVGSLLGRWVAPGALLATTVLALTASLLDLAGMTPPGPKRQVNESWIGHYRGWVYGGAFGAELGAGVATYVVTWAVYAVFAVEVLTGSPARGAAVGALFGLGRSLALWLAAGIDRPSRLTAFHQRMARLGPRIRWTGAAALAATGLVAALGGLW